nr:MAG TPA: hypothetical protein [Caudoviricetes sp.]
MAFCHHIVYRQMRILCKGIEKIFSELTAAECGDNISDDAGGMGRLLTGVVPVEREADGLQCLLLGKTAGYEVGGGGVVTGGTGAPGGDHDATFAEGGGEGSAVDAGETDGEDVGSAILAAFAAGQIDVEIHTVATKGNDKLLSDGADSFLIFCHVEGAPCECGGHRTDKGDGDRAAAHTALLCAAEDHGGDGAPLLDDQRAYALEGAELVAAEGHVVRTQRLEVHGDVAYGGGGVTENKAALFTETFDIVELAGFVVDQHLCEVQFGVLGDVVLLYRLGNGVMLKGTGYQGTSALVRRGADALDRPVASFSGAGGEIHLVRFAVQFVGDDGTARFQFGLSLAPNGVGAGRVAEDGELCRGAEDGALCRVAEDGALCGGTKCAGNGRRGSGVVEIDHGNYSFRGLCVDYRKYSERNGNIVYKTSRRAVCRPARNVGYFVWLRMARQLFTASLSCFAGLKMATRLAGTVMVSPVAGFLPGCASRTLLVKMPKPEIFTLSPERMTPVRVLAAAAITRSTSDFFMSVAADKVEINSLLVMECASFLL